MGLRNQDHLRPAPIGKGRFLNATSQGSSDFVLGKIRAESAIGVREPAADIALKTGAARYDLWQGDRWYHQSTHRITSICGHKRVPIDARLILAPFGRGVQGMLLFIDFFSQQIPHYDAPSICLLFIWNSCCRPFLTLPLPLYAHKAHVTVLSPRMRSSHSHGYCLYLTCLPPTSYTAAGLSVTS